MRYIVYCSCCGKRHKVCIGERIRCDCDAFIKLTEGTYPFHCQAIIDGGILDWKETDDDTDKT